MTIHNIGLFDKPIDIYEQQQTPAYEVSNGTVTGYAKVTGSGTGIVYVAENTAIYDDTQFTHKIAEASGQDYYYVSLDAVTDALGEINESYVKFKTLFARIETRVGGLLSGRPADTVMSTVTHKFSWRFRSLQEVLPHRHKIKYGGKWFNVNYCLNDGFKNDILEVFVTQEVG